jgi:hypothetical protein
MDALGNAYTAFANNPAGFHGGTPGSQEAYCQVGQVVSPLALTAGDLLPRLDAVKLSGGDFELTGGSGGLVGEPAAFDAGESAVAWLYLAPHVGGWLAHPAYGINNVPSNADFPLTTSMTWPFPEPGVQSQNGGGWPEHTAPLTSINDDHLVCNDDFIGAVEGVWPGHTAGFCCDPTLLTTGLSGFCCDLGFMAVGSLWALSQILRSKVGEPGRAGHGTGGPPP